MKTLDTPLHHDTAFWRALFDAESIAVIGAKEVPGTWGFDTMRSSVESMDFNKKRQVYPVNPGAAQVMGIPAYNTVLDIPGPVELAVIVVPARVVPQVFRQCAEKGVKAAVIVSAGFGEVDDGGAALEAEIVKTAHEYGLRFIGPNCIGHADFHTRVASAGMAGRMPSGPMSLISQSGTLGASIMQTVSNRGIGLSKLVSTGNEANLHLEDCLEYLGTDDRTEVIACYIEGLREGRRFFELAQNITLDKPVVAIKSGGTGEAAKAARSHTGALSGSEAIYTAAFKQSGVIRAEDEEELGDVVQGLLYQPLPKGNRVAILTMGGGFGVVTAEACEREGLAIARLEESTLQKIDKVLPARWNRGNPVDLVGTRPGAGNNTVASCLRALLEDKNVDAVISLLPPSVSMRGLMEKLSPETLREMHEESEKALDKLAGELKGYSKPVYMISRFSFLPEGIKTSYVPVNRIPEYTHQRRGARVIGHLAWYRHYLDTRKK